MSLDQPTPRQPMSFQPMSFHAQVRRQALGVLAGTSASSAAELNSALRLLAKWRCALIQDAFVRRCGVAVLDGVLKGMTFLPQSAEGCHIPKLLGCYEQPLQPHIEAAVQAGYPLVLNIGCAEGYYAVGMARRMPASRILAFDIAPWAREACAALAAGNGAARRVEVGGLFKPDDFAAFAGQNVLVLCDIEGAERDLLDPARSPALAGMDLIVESHEGLVPGVTRLLTDRFAATHAIAAVHDDGQRRLSSPPPWFVSLPHLDQLLALWEWRSGPTPWLVMKARSRREP